MRLVGWLLLLISLGIAGCTGECTNCVTNTDGGPDGGCISCDGGPFNIYVLDSRAFGLNGFETIPLFQMQLAPNGNIGIAYVELSADQTNNKPRADPLIFNYDILYAEWFNGSMVLGPERVTGAVPVQRYVGVSLDYANGVPVVGYMGWVAPPGYDGTGGLGDGGATNQAFWFQHDAVVSYRNANGTWTQNTAGTNGAYPGVDPAAAGSPACAASGSCSLGPITGLYPAVFGDSTETLVAFRNVHFGSSTGPGDFANSNLDLATGSPGNWQYLGLAWGKPGIEPLQPTRSCPPVAVGRGAFGNHSKFIHGAGNNPALIGDRGGPSNTYNGNGTDVIFFERKAGTWSCPLSLFKLADKGNLSTYTTENGPYMAYDAQGQGYAVAVSDVSGSGAAYYKNCLPGNDCTALNAGLTEPLNWSVFSAVYLGPGTGGYFASVALNPDTHDPWVAYYLCSSASGANVSNCPVSQRSLQVATSIMGLGQWAPQTVDPAGAWQTQSFYIPGSPSRLVIGYRDPSSGALKLAVENPR